jgi:hypothetical protein
MSKSRVKVKASETLVASFVDDGQGPRVVLGLGTYKSVETPLVIGTTRDEVRGVIRALAECLEELPGAGVQSPSDMRTKRVTAL